MNERPYEMREGHMRLCLFSPSGFFFLSFFYLGELKRRCTQASKQASDG